MNKIGKRYNLFSIGSFKSLELNKLAKEYQISLSEETKEFYNSEKNKYFGSILFSCENRRALKEFESSPEFQNFINTREGREIKETIDTNFFVDCHYEELKELSGLKEETEKLSQGSSSLDGQNLYKFKSSFEYNFLIKRYEEYIADVPETALPYFYETLDGFIDNQNYDKFEGTTFFERPDEVIFSGSRDELVTNVIPSLLSISGSKVVSQTDKYLKKFDVYKEQFPFYTDISFDTHEKSKTNITDILHKRNYYTSLLQNCVSSSIDNSLLARQENTDTPQILTVKELNMDNFLTHILNQNAVTDFSFIFDINSVVDGKARSFLEVFNGEKEYCEVAAYHLKKYDGATLLQEWYIPNTSESGINFVDTQIKYNKNYTYKLDLIVLTISTSYLISNVSTKNKGIIVEYENTPLIKLFVLGNIGSTQSTIGATYTNKLLDFPPIEPEVEFIPYIQVENKIKINLNTSIGKKTVPAISFSNNENEDLNSLKESQNKNINSSMLTYQGDEPSDLFEIYRLDFQPYSYEDFFANLLNVIKTDNASAAAFEDTIEPNKKYYYIARSLDYHGHFSNPTPIYEVEIMSDNGLIVPLIKVVDFANKEVNTQENKSLKKYLKIQPAIRHRVLNNEKLSNNVVQLGSEEVDPWNKNFKIRITSKSSGKKIDINFKFNYNKPT